MREYFVHVFMYTMRKVVDTVGPTAISMCISSDECVLFVKSHSDILITSKCNEEYTQVHS